MPQNSANPVPPKKAEPVSDKPANPEMDIVKANQPALPAQTPTPILPAGTKSKSSTSAPKKITDIRKPASKGKFLVGCAGAFVILFVVFIALMVLMLSRAGANNAVIRAFGLDATGIKSFLQGVVGFSFGFLSLIFLTLMVIGIFRTLSTPKSNKEKRSKSVKMIFFNLVPLFLILISWLSLYSFIGKVEIAAEQVVAEILVIKPEDFATVQAPVEVTLSAINVAKAIEFGRLSIDSMAWDLEGDGTFETPVTTPEVVHLYNRNGAYNVGLKVQITGEEQPRIYNKLITIQTATFGAIPPTGTAPLEVNFDATSLIPSKNMQSIDWDFDGDGTYDQSGDKTEASYKYETIGTFKAHLRLIDKQNNVQNYYRDIEITQSEVPLLTAAIAATPGLTGEIPLQIRFDASDSASLKGTIVKYEWNFGDGSELQTGKTVSHVYQESGSYSATLKITEDSGNTAETTVEVVAQSGASIPEAVISTDVLLNPETGELYGTLPLKVEFDGSKSKDPSKDIVDYEWDFNSDSVVDQDGAKAVKTFDQVGTFIVTLTVRDTEGNEANTTLNVTVTEPGIIAVISAVPQEGTAPLIVQFDGSGSSAFDGSIVSYEWEFGDGSPVTVTGASLSHKYNTVGNYTVRLKVVSNKSEQAETTLVIYVREVPLRACFTPSRKNGMAPLTVTFDSACSTGTVSTYSWKFGDGEVSDTRKPNHTFAAPGTYTVELEVADDKNNVDTYSEVIVAEGEALE